MTKNVLITGASGFLGSKLALEFLALGHNVSLILRPNSLLDRLGKHASEFIIERPTQKFEFEDFLSRTSPDTIVHTACSYGRNGECPVELSDGNFRFGLMVMQSAIMLGKSVNFINTGTVLQPEVNLYALTKHYFSKTGHILASDTNSKLSFINVYLEHMYGPGDHDTKFTTHVLKACLKNVPKLDLTSGTQARDFIYIDDVISALVKIVERAENLGVSTNIEVGSGEAPSVREFVETAHRLTGSSTRLNFGAVPFRAKEALHSQADITFMKTMGWKPKFNLETGIKKTLELGV